MCLALGFAERISREICNAAVFIDDLGAVRGKCHRMAFGEGYHDSWWFNRVGYESRAIDTPFGPCGFMICYDRWEPRAVGIPVL